MNIKPTNISDEEKARIFNESMKRQKPYVEKEPVRISSNAELNKRIDDVLMELDIQNNKTKKKIQQLEDEVHNLRIILGLLSIVAVGIWTIQWIL